MYTGEFDRRKISPLQGTGRLQVAGMVDACRAYASRWVEGIFRISFKKDTDSRIGFVSFVWVKSKNKLAFAWAEKVTSLYGL